MMDFSVRLQSLTAEPSRDTGDDPARRARVSHTRDEMMDQGAVMSATIASEANACAELAARITAREVNRIVVAGCGDSWFAGMGARSAMELATGLPVEPVQAFDWANYASGTADERTLVIGISSGGSTPAVVAALDAAHARGALAIGMSNTPGSVVLTRYDGGLVVHASRRGWPTQSSTAAIGLLISLALHTGAHRGQPADLLESLDKGLLGVATAMDRTARVLDGPTREWARQIADATLILFAGAGPHFAAAAFGAAKVRELSPIHAQAMPLEEYHHYRSQKLRDPLFLLAPDARSRERALDTALVSADVGGRTVALLPGPDPDIESRVSATWRLPPSHSALAPLLYSVPMHLFAFHFAEARFEANLGHPALLTEA